MKNMPYNVLRHCNSWEVAPRDPVTIGSLILTGSTAAGAAATGLAWIGYATVGYIATTAVTSLALSALAPKPSISGTQGTIINAREAAAPQEYVYGQIRKGGVMTFMETTGASNKYMHIVLTLAGHEVEEIGSIYINDEIVTIDGSGFVTGSRWNSKIRIKKWDGSQTTADADFVAETSADSAFVARGIAALYIRLEYDQNVFTGGIPLFTAVVKGRKVYDPRTETTSYSANAALCIRDYITWSAGLNDAEINDVQFAVAANDCDDDITLSGGGTQKRYEINGIIRSDQGIGSNLTSMVQACNGSIPIAGGTYGLRVGVYSASVASFTLDDLRSEIDLQTRHSLRNNFNQVVGKFINKDEGWIEADYPAITSSAFLGEDAGIENQIDLSLSMVTDAAQAQRVAKQTLFRSREQMTLVADFGLRAIGVEIGDIVDLTISEYGFSQKEFEVIDWELKIADTGGVRIGMTLRETSSSAFSWDAEESEIISNNTTLLEYSSAPVLGISVSSTLRVYHEKLSNVVSLVTTSSQASFIDYVQVEFKKSSETSWRDGGYGDLGLFEINDIEDGTYDFRARSVNGFGVKGAWTTRSSFKVEGLSQPPQDVTGLAAEVNGDTINLSWTPVPDLDLSYYIIRHAKETSGATWSGAVTYVEKVARPSTDVSVPAKAGTYLIKAVDKTGVQSVNATSVVVTADEVNARATVVTIDEDPTFAGTKTDVVVQDNELRLGSVTLFDGLSGNVDDLVGQWDALGVSYSNTDGTYYFDNIIDRTVAEQGFITVDIKTRRFDTTGGLWDDLAGNIDVLAGYWDDLTGGADFNDTNVIAYVSTTNDDPAGSPTWSAWRKIRAANVYGRALRFKVELHSDAAGISPAISELSATGNYS